MDHRKYLRPADAAQKIHVTVGTLANWRWKGVGPAYYAIGGLIRYADDEVEGWLKAGWRPRPCENVREPRTRSIVFSLVFLR